MSEESDRLDAIAAFARKMGHPETTMAFARHLAEGNEPTAMTDPTKKPPPSRPPARTTSIGVRLTVEEYNAVVDAAVMAGQTISDWLLAAISAAMDQKPHS